MAIQIMAIFVKKLTKNHIYGEFLRIREFTLAIIFAIFPKNGKFRLKTKIMKFHGIQPIYARRRKLMKG